jgi:hypothetical protein
MTYLVIGLKIAVAYFEVQHKQLSTLRWILVFHFPPRDRTIRVYSRQFRTRPLVCSREIQN